MSGCVWSVWGKEGQNLDLFFFKCQRLIGFEDLLSLSNPEKKRLKKK